MLEESLLQKYPTHEVQPLLGPFLALADDLAHPEVDDVFDDLGAMVLKLGGEVVIVPTERMPTETGIAAIYRY